MGGVSSEEEPGSACWHRGCGNPDAPHGITWKCPDGHRVTLRYCRAHAGKMTVIAMRAAANPDALPGCAKCPGPGALMRPVLEGAPV